MALKGARRAFRTVFFTDVVGSTEMAAQLGDRRWRRTVAAHNAAIRRELKRHKGVEVDTAGDGFFAIFEIPTDALRCAAAAVAAVHGLGLRIRAGVHTGEVEPAGAKVGGLAVHIGARLLAMAGAEEVLVSSTVRDLVVGSGHEFDDRGTHELRGVPGQWHVYSLQLPRLDQSLAVGAADDDEARLVAAVRRQRLVVGALFAVIGALALGLVGLYLAANRPTLPPTGADTVVAFEGGAERVVRGWRVGVGPEALALADGVLWVASTGSGTVTRIDLVSGASLSLGQGGDRPSAVHLEGNRAWVTDRYSSEIAILDAGVGGLIERLPEHASAMAAIGGRVWLADDLGDRLVAVDAQTFAVASEIPLDRPAGPSDLAATAGALWVAAPRAGSLFRVDPLSGAVQPIDVGVPGVRVVASSGNDLWLVSPLSDTVARIDVATGRVEVRATLCDLPVAVAPLADGAWVACAADRLLLRVDRAGTLVQEIALDAVPADVAADASRVWVALRAD